MNNLTADQLHPALIVGPICTGKTHDLKQLAKECFAKHPGGSCYVWSGDAWDDVDTVARKHSIDFHTFDVPYSNNAESFLHIIHQLFSHIERKQRDNVRDDEFILIIIDDVSTFTSYLEPSQIERLQAQLRRFGRQARKYGVHLLLSDCTGTVRDMQVFINFPRYPSTLASSHPNYDSHLGKKERAHV